MGTQRGKTTLQVICEKLHDLRVCVCVFETSIVFFWECVPVSDMELYSPGGRGVSHYASSVMASQQSPALKLMWDFCYKIKWCVPAGEELGCFCAVVQLSCISAEDRLSGKTSNSKLLTWTWEMFFFWICNAKQWAFLSPVPGCLCYQAAAFPQGWEISPQLICWLCHNYMKYKTTQGGPLVQRLVLSPQSKKFGFLSLLVLSVDFLQVLQLPITIQRQASGVRSF